MFLCSFILMLTTYYTVCAYEKCTDCSIPTLVYEDMKCTPKYSNSNRCCPIEYDCSHIYNRPKHACHLKGKFYQTYDEPDKEDVSSLCEHSHCECAENGVFRCIVASDSCAEFWVPNLVQPQCYLTFKQNRCCHVAQKCPPFDENSPKCDVQGKVYKKGEKFEHPKKKCTKCVCEEGFDGKLDKPFCQRYNCTSELFWSNKIHNYCAPAYLHWEDCCPRKWICPSENGMHLLALTSPSVDAPKCKFGNKVMNIGDKYKFGREECECIIPPYLTCTY